MTNAVGKDGLLHVMRATGGESATTLKTEAHLDGGGEQAIGLNQRHGGPLRESHVV